MNNFEILLLILVVIWSLILLISSVSLILLFLKVKKGIDRINIIIENITNPISKAISGAVFIKDAIGSIVKVKKKRK